MKTAFIIVVFLHALLHFIGFYQAHSKPQVLQLSSYISRPLGWLWLLVGLVLLGVLILKIKEIQAWPFFAIAAVILSQTLILTHWQEARFGSIINVLILLVSIPALGNFHFNKMAEKEVRHMFEMNTPKQEKIITKKEIEHLPAPVQKWLLISGVIGKPEIQSLRLQQKGEMRTTPGGRWMPFTAVQYFVLNDPAFVWQARVNAMPGVKLVGRDKLQYGRGEMKIKLLSLFPVVNEKGNHEIDSGTMLRFLGEICWFPSAALNNYISWEEIDERTALAHFQQNGIEVKGTFQFTPTGEIESFEAERYYSRDNGATLERWHIRAEAYNTFEGIKVPSISRVTWKLEEGDFNWLNLEITGIEYNNRQIYD